MSGSASGSPSAKRVLMIVRDDSRDHELMLRDEVFLMRRMIADAGYAVDVVTATDAPLTGGEVTLAPDLTLDAVQPEDYQGLMLPCMAPVPGTPMPDRLIRLIERVVVRDIPTGAMRGSVRELARAGGLKGRKYAYAGPVDLDEQPEFRGATFVGTDVTKDRKVATAGICPLAALKRGDPDATAALTEAFIELLEAEHT